MCLGACKHNLFNGPCYWYPFKFLDRCNTSVERLDLKPPLRVAAVGTPKFRPQSFGRTDTGRTDNFAPLLNFAHLPKLHVLHHKGLAQKQKSSGAHYFAKNLIYHVAYYGTVNQQSTVFQCFSLRYKSSLLEPFFQWTDVRLQTQTPPNPS